MCRISTWLARIALAVAAGSAFGTDSHPAVKCTVGRRAFRTYPFSDPDPIPCTETTRYPYPRFDDCAATSDTVEWTVVELESDQLLVTILPQVGGRIWGVKDKQSGRNVVYFNHVVKFRNIAQRGAWTSGGIEMNFGIIGHSPVTATPVDWTTRENADGSASYFVRMRELICRTEWQVEVRLAPGDDFFTTSVIWHNASYLPAPYYQWMTAAFPVTEDARFFFPGTEWIGHEGDAHPWPRDAAGHDLSKYAENAFGHNKSYHVVNGDSRHFGVWYPSWNVGLLHENRLGEKFGRKVWIWSQAREGAIWEDLLTDSDGQYVELQSGRCFNQPRNRTVETPFKHATFAPGCTDRFVEKWRVVRSWDAMESLSKPEDRVARPTLAPKDFDWTTAYGHYVRGQQFLRERQDRKGNAELDIAIKKEPCFLPALTEKAALEFRRGRYAETRRLCEKALSIDTYDPKANYLDGYAALVLGERTTAKERLGMAAFSPLYRKAAQTLSGRADGIVEPTPQGFVDCGESRCEFPGETAAERATPYEESGRIEEALAQLAKSDSPICDLRRAHLLDITDRREEACALRVAALAKPISGVFPFRREERAPLESAVRTCPGNWKAAYYLAVLESYFGEDERARERLEKCGTVPDEWVFYAYRARNSRDSVADLSRAESLGGDWRVGRDLMRELMRLGRPKDAVEAGVRYLKRYPRKNALELPYARALQLAGRNRDCVDFLATVNILPSEFGDDAHAIWADAWRALGNENKAREYPENLGAGAPYQTADAESDTGAETVDAARQYTADWDSLNLRPTPAWWTEAKFGIFVHWGVYSVPAYAPVDKESLDMCYCYAEHYQHRLLQKIPAFLDFNAKFNAGRPYGDFVAEFKAEHFDAAKWADLFRRAGAKYAVLTAKHHDGFALWPTKAGGHFNSWDAGPRRDICREFTDAMRTAGLKAGFYYSLVEYGNAQWDNTETRDAFVRNVNLVQLKELAADYGADVIWPDGDWMASDETFRSRDYLAWLYNESPVRQTVVVNDRWGKGGRGRNGGHYTTEYGFEVGEIGDGEKGRATAAHPWEECRGLGLSFGYNRFERATDYLTAGECVRLLVRVAAGGGNLLLNIGPDRHGFVPPIMEDRLLEIGRWLDVNGEAIYGTTRWRKSPGDAKMNAGDLFFTEKGSVVYAIATRWPTAAFRVEGVRNVASVTLLGSDAKVDWTAEPDALTITPPTVNPGNAPCDHAWTFKISL